MNITQLSGAELRKLATGRTKLREDARAEIARRVNNRLLKGKHVPAPAQKIANAHEDKLAREAARQQDVQVSAINYDALLAELFDKGAVRWAADGALELTK